jgi:NAD(P)-dependent dehydrogenase (short-subunit alcohol dehydrogenase family)
MSESVVVVTGALTGIGEATAQAFARRGDVVVVSGRHDDVGKQLARDLQDAGARMRCSSGPMCASSVRSPS